MRGSRRNAAIAALMGFAVIAAACGSDDSDTASDGESTGGTIDEGVQEAAQEQLQSEGTGETEEGTDERPASMEDWEALWEEERAAIVERIGAEGWGLEGDTVTGPGGFTIDLTQCPAGWSNTEGLTDSEIKIGHTTAQSGTLAAYGNIARGMDAYFGTLNEAGFFADSEGATRSINLIVRDDGYDSARTIPLVDELIDSEKVFAMWTLGSPNTMKTYDKLNDRCIPQPLSMTGHPAWGDPVNHPWTTGMQLSYSTEAVLWGEFIEDRLDSEFGGSVKVAALVMNNDFGAAYDFGFQAFLDQSENADNIEYVVERIEPQAPTVKDPMTTLAAQNPDVFIAMTAGVSCTQAITEASENGLKESAAYLFQPSVCKSLDWVGAEKVGGDGSAADDWWVVGGGAIEYNSPAYDDDAWVAFARDTLAANGLDYRDSANFGIGFSFGWGAAQALKVAGELDGGLNRTNFILALRAMDMTPPGALPGIGFNMNGNDDAYLTEGSDIAQFDAEAQAWQQVGDIIELSGKSANCAWDQSTSTCA